MAKRRIHSKGNFRLEEAVAAEDITPGMLVEFTSAGKVQKHSTEGGYAERAIALEDYLQGNTVSDDYSSSDEDRVLYGLFAPGSVANVLVAVDENISKGDMLVSNGNGLFVEDSNVSSGATNKQIMAVAMENCDLTQSGDSNTLCQVRIL